MINIDEDCFFEATDPNGRSKIDAEEILFKWCKNNIGTCTKLRLPLLVGRNPVDILS